jgi:hypothetical protein
VFCSIHPNKLGKKIRNLVTTNKRRL